METDWEKRYQAGTTHWDKGCASPGLVRFIGEKPLTGRILVPGCGFGHDAAAIASAGAEEVVGMDLAPSAVEGAIQRYQLPNLSFKMGDFLNLPHLNGQEYDAAFEHTLFCAIAPNRREDYVRAMARALKSGGILLAVFYMNPDVAPDEGPPFGSSKAELDALFEGFFEMQSEWIPAEAFAGRENRELMRLLRRNDISE